MHASFTRLQEAPKQKSKHGVQYIKSLGRPWSSYEQLYLSAMCSFNRYLVVVFEHGDGSCFRLSL